jgi:hypothetical protein
MNQLHTFRTSPYGAYLMPEGQVGLSFALVDGGHLHVLMDQGQLETLVRLIEPLRAQLRERNAAPTESPDGQS